MVCLAATPMRVPALPVYTTFCIYLSQQKCGMAMQARRHRQIRLHLAKHIWRSHHEQSAILPLASTSLAASDADHIFVARLVFKP